MHRIITQLIQAALQGLYSSFLLVAGPLCATASGIIEYQVVAALLPKTYWLIPLMIVFPFESAKLFFIFWYPHMTEDNGYSVGRRRAYGFIRWVLITFSAMATLLFTFFNLYDPGYENKITEKTEQLDQRYQHDRTQLEQQYDMEIQRTNEACGLKEQRISARYDDEIAHWQKKMQQEERYRDSKGNFNGPRYKTYKAQYDDAIQRRDDAIEQVNCGIEALQQKKQTALAALHDQHKATLDSLPSQLRGSPEAGNPYLVATIHVVGQIKGDTPFPYKAYIASIFLLSIWITMAMEGVIYAALTTLSLLYGAAFIAKLQQKTMAEEYQAAQEAVQRFDDIERKTFQEKLINMREGFEDALRHMHRRYERSSTSALLSQLWQRIKSWLTKLFPSKDQDA